jgi:hypothetical protein
MDRESFNQWLAAYGRAWISRDPNAAASLYTDEATDQVTPFAEPLRGRPAIRDYCIHVAKTEDHVQFRYDILAVESGYGIAHWQATFVIIPQSLHTTLDGIFLISMDSTGRCQSLREWWNKRQ